MRVIITGGTGFIGRRLTKSLANDGHEVVVLSRKPNQAGTGKVSFRQWDARTATGWGDAADGADAIVNLAAENLAGESFFPARWTDERKRRIRESRTNAGNAIVEAVKAASNKPRLVIQQSGSGYYGSTQSDEIITEDHPAGSDFLAEVCKGWEDSTAGVEAFGVRRVIARTGVVLSFHDGALQRLALPFKLFVGGTIGSGKQYLPWIHPDDEVRAVRFLIDNADASGAFNVCTPNPMTNAQFSKTMGKVMGRPSLIPVPGFAFNLAFGEVAMVVLEGQRVIPKRLLEMGYTFKFPELEGALRDLYLNKSGVSA